MEMMPYRPTADRRDAVAPGAVAPHVGTGRARRLARRACPCCAAWASRCAS